MKDEFESYATGLTAPARDGAAITPDNGADLATATRALFVGAAGDVRVQMVSGQTVTLSNCQAGVIYPVRAARVLATGTTAGALVGLW